jgi:hypothetical protein
MNLVEDSLGNPHIVRHIKIEHPHCQEVGSVFEAIIEG